MTREPMKETRQSRRSALEAALLIALMALLLLPACYTAFLGFHANAAPEGLRSAGFVGFANYAALWSSPYRNSILANTLTLSLGNFAISLALGILGAFFVPRIRGRGCRHIALGVMLSLAFIPSLCWAAGVLPKTTANPSATPFYYALITGLAGAGLVGFAGAAYAMVWPGRGFWRGAGLAALLWVFLCMTPPLDALWPLQTPENYAAMEAVDSYALRVGVVGGQYGEAGALFSAKALLQLLLGAVVAFGFYMAFLRHRQARIDTVARQGRTLSLALWLVPALMLAAAGLVYFWPGLALLSGGPALLSALPAQAINTLLSALAAFLFAWGLIAGLRKRRFRTFLLCAGLLLATQYPLAGGYLLILKAGGLNSPLPGILMALFTPEGMLLTLLCARLSGAERHAHRPSWLISLLPASYAAACYWGGGQTVAALGLTISPFGDALRQQVTGGIGTDLTTFCAVLVPPLIIGALGSYALYRYMDAEKALIS